MIKFQLDGKSIACQIETGTNSRPTIIFHRECASELEAELLYRLIDRRLDDKVEEIRKQEYNLGWEDHRKRNTKRDFFYITLDAKKY